MGDRRARRGPLPGPYAAIAQPRVLGPGGCDVVGACHGLTLPVLLVPTRRRTTRYRPPTGPPGPKSNTRSLTGCADATADAAPACAARPRSPPTSPSWPPPRTLRDLACSASRPQAAETGPSPPADHKHEAQNPHNAPSDVNCRPTRPQRRPTRPLQTARTGHPDEAKPTRLRQPHRPRRQDRNLHNPVQPDRQALPLDLRRHPTQGRMTLNELTRCCTSGLALFAESTRTRRVRVRRRPSGRPIFREWKTTDR
jgi:hypothetical protein